MDSLITSLGRTLGFAAAAGINLYATIAILGLAARYHWVALPEHYRVFDNDWIIGAAIVLYLVEFVADKVPWVDSLWDAVHTVIRPVGGAFIAVASVGNADPAVQAMAGVLGVVLAGTTHAAKASTRVAANASPEPFSNWILSFAEDGFVVGLGVLALTYPLAAAVVVVVLLVTIFVSARWLVRKIRKRRI